VIGVHDAPPTHWFASQMPSPGQVPHSSFWPGQPAPMVPQYWPPGGVHTLDGTQAPPPPLVPPVMMIPPVPVTLPPPRPPDAAPAKPPDPLGAPPVPVVVALGFVPAQAAAVSAHARVISPSPKRGMRFGGCLPRPKRLAAGQRAS